MADPLRTEPLGRPVRVVDQMRRLHRGDDPASAESRDIGRPEVLRVLHPEPPVARPVGAREAVVDVEQQTVPPLADRVDRHLEAGGIGGPDPGPQGILGRAQHAGRLGIVGVGLVEQRRAGAQRPIHVTFDAADPHRSSPRPLRAIVSATWRQVASGK